MGQACLVSRDQTRGRTLVLGPNRLQVTNLQGDRQSPDYRVDVQGNDLQIPDYRVGRIRLQGGTLGDRRTQLEAEDVMIDGRAIERIALDLDGPLRDAVYRISAQSGDYTLDSSGDLQWQDGVTRLRPESLRADGGVLGEQARKMMIIDLQRVDVVGELWKFGSQSV